MRVAKWGNSLAVRIPAELAAEMGLKEGHEIEFSRKGANLVEVSPKDIDAVMRERLKSFRGMILDDFEFEREETNKRG